MNTSVRSYIERIKERNKREREGGADSSMMENQSMKNSKDRIRRGKGAERPAGVSKQVFGG